MTAARKNTKNLKPSAPANEEDPQSMVNELVHRALTMGLSGWFNTQETLRKAVGEAMPDEWVHFASEQSDRAKKEFVDRLSEQIGTFIKNIDLNDLVKSALEDRTIELNASLKIHPPREGKEETSYELSVKPRKKPASRAGKKAAAK